MTYLNMPADQESVTKQDFINWANRYISFRCKEQITGVDFYGARCATLYTYGVESKLSPESKCRLIIYDTNLAAEFMYYHDIKKDLIMLSASALRHAFFIGIDNFLMQAYADASRRKILDTRLKTLCQQFAF